MFRLLLEYGRIIDDNRDRIGYSGDGSELDRFDNGGNGWSERFGFDIGKKIWKGAGDRFGFGKGPERVPAGATEIKTESKSDGSR